MHSVFKFNLEREYKTSFESTEWKYLSNLNILFLGDHSYFQFFTTKVSRHIDMGIFINYTLTHLVRFSKIYSSCISSIDESICQKTISMFTSS